MPDKMFPCRGCGMLVGFQSECATCCAPICERCKGNKNANAGDWIFCEKHKTDKKEDMFLLIWNRIWERCNG